MNVYANKKAIAWRTLALLLIAMVIMVSVILVYFTYSKKPLSIFERQGETIEGAYGSAEQEYNRLIGKECKVDSDCYDFCSNECSSLGLPLKNYACVNYQCNCECKPR